MDIDSRLQEAGALVAPWTKESNTPEPNRLDVTLESADLISAIGALNEARWGFLSAITGLDMGAAADQIQVLYHLCSGAAVVTLRARTPRASPTVPSISGIIPPAILFERELMEMFGVAVIGVTDREHLFLPEDWQEGVYPLRKDSGI
jgi:Ni,Fe-hydrogenase III component G